MCITQAPIPLAPSRQLIKREAHVLSVTHKSPCFSALTRVLQHTRSTPAPPSAYITDLPQPAPLLGPPPCGFGAACPRQQHQLELGTKSVLPSFHAIALKTSHHILPKLL